MNILNFFLQTFLIYLFLSVVLVKSEKAVVVL